MDTGTEVKTRRRYWRRAERPTRGWWPGGVLPLLALLLLLAYGSVVVAPNAEQQVQAQVTRTLSDAGVSLERVVADGQRVQVIALAEPTEQAAIEAMAAGSRCETWVGDLVCPGDVRVTLRAAEPPPQTSIPAQGGFSIVLEEGTLKLRGERPAEVARTALESSTLARFESFSGTLEPVAMADPEPYLAAFDRALAVLASLRSGTAVWADGALSIQGVAPETAQQAAHSAFFAPGFTALGDLDLTPPSPSEVCDESFRRALSEATVRFRTASAEIAPESRPALSRLAALASTCGGLLVVEGHTDSLGSTPANDALSEARAAAVVQALEALGVDGGRLRAVGLGARQPVADNATPAGRALNRRIVVRTALDVDPGDGISADQRSPG